jgi:hypothetical protein
MSADTVSLVPLQKFKPQAWYLPRHSSFYRGSYPRGFEKRLQEFIGFNDYLHVFVGQATSGSIKVDINLEHQYKEYNHKLNVDVAADAHKLPFKDNTF